MPTGAQMAALVQGMLDKPMSSSAHKQPAAEGNPQVGPTVPGWPTVLQRQIEATVGQIDRLVYALYGLTEEEIGIVEGQG